MQASIDVDGVGFVLTTRQRNHIHRAEHGNGKQRDGQLGADGDGLEAQELRATGRVHMAPVAAGEGNKASKTEATREWVRNMGPMLGNTNVLQQRSQGIVIWAVNPAGHMRPYTRGGRYREDCKLPLAAALIESDIADIVCLPEAHVDAAAVREARLYVAKECMTGTEEGLTATCDGGVSLGPAEVL